MSRDVVQNSRYKSYADQQNLVQKYPGYQVPNIIDATVSIFVEYVSTGTKLYNDTPWTYTRCQEKWNKDWQLVAGGFSSDGLDVLSDDYVYGHYGMSLLRKF